MEDHKERQYPHLLLYGALAAAIMAYGWGYRGTVGHEAGAMLPGALLGLALCVGSGRLDWHRRAAVAGLFGAVGWAWGGSLSYMEQTFYTLSGSFPDVLYGYGMLFLLGGLWAGIGGGVFGLALTEPRSELERLMRPFAAICAAFLASHLYFFFVPKHFEAYETLTVRHFHAGDWLAATIALLVSGVYWLLRPKDRPATALFFLGAVGWWVGYLSLTKFGGLRLAPLHRNENWGGVVGILVVLMLYLVKRHNRAALMLCLYGILGGGLAFAAAVFIRHPGAIEWGPFTKAWPQWRMAEESFGFFMGLAIALGASRLTRGRLAPPQEDTPRPPLDVYAIFVILVALTWINFRRHAAPWLVKANSVSGASFPWMPGWMWYVLGGGMITIPLLYILYRYLRGERQLAPGSAFGKGAIVTLFLVWLAAAGYSMHEAPSGGTIAGHLILWIPAAVASCLLLSFSSGALKAVVPVEATVLPSDPKWRVGRTYWMIWGLVPFFLLAITWGSITWQGGPRESLGRKRFGPDAYWHQTARLMGTWNVAGRAKSLQDPPFPSSNLPLMALVFDESRNVAAVLPSGETLNAHQWFLKNQYTWLRWYGRKARHPERAEIPIEFRDRRIYVAWPPGKQNEGFLVFERVEK